MVRARELFISQKSLQRQARQPIERAPETGAILVAEADPTTLVQVVEEVQSLGYRVASADNGQEALEYARTHAPVLVLANIDLPRLSGFELCRQIRSEAEIAHIPFVLLADRGEVPDRVVGVQTGADDYLCKPLEANEVRTRIKSLLRRRLAPAAPAIAPLEPAAAAVPPPPPPPKPAPPPPPAPLPAAPPAPSPEPTPPPLRPTTPAPLRQPAQKPAIEPISRPVIRPVAKPVGRPVVRPAAGPQPSVGVAPPAPPAAPAPPAPLPTPPPVPEARPPAPAPPSPLVVAPVARPAPVVQPPMPVTTPLPRPSPEAAAPPPPPPPPPVATPGPAPAPDATAAPIPAVRAPLTTPAPRAVSEPPAVRAEQEKKARAESERLYDDAARWVEGSMRSVREQTRVNLNSCRDIAAQIAESLFASNALLLKSLGRHHYFDIASQSVNVTIFAVKIGFGLGQDKEDITRIGMVALCNNIGMARVPTELVAGNRKLSEREKAQIYAHPRYTYEAIIACGQQYEWLARATSQVHEREGGQGYPNGLKGSEIDEYARIVGVADVFEASCHSRPYPRRQSRTLVAFEALQEVIDMRGESLAAHVIKALIKEVSVFPLESYVKLNTGEIGRVVGTNEGNLLRPKVSVEFDANGNRLKRPRTVDLAKRPLLYIFRPVDPDSLPV